MDVSIGKAVPMSEWFHIRRIYADTGLKYIGQGNIRHGAIVDTTIRIFGNLQSYASVMLTSIYQLDESFHNLIK